MNLHIYKKKYREIVRLLRESYEKKEILTKKLDGINAKVYRLEKARNNCSTKVRELKNGKEKGKVKKKREFKKVKK